MTNFYPVQKSLSNLLVIMMVFTFMGFSVSSLAQTKGKITGRVTDASTNDKLPGANLFLKGTNYGAASDRTGQFRIDNVIPGSYELVCSYMGYDKFSTEVNVTAGGVTEVYVELKSSYVEMEEIVVQGERQGQVKALSQQRTSNTIKNVVSEEQMQRFPDLNTAEVLQRIPAVSIERDQGEGRYVLVRGTEARLNSMTVNGERLPSPDGGERAVPMDVISSEQLASIEVTKALTPDMDGDAIGGSVNLVTKSAFDYQGRYFNISTGGGYGDLMGKPLYQGGFTYADQFGANKNIGLTVSGSYYQSNRGSHNNEMEWGSEDDVNDNEIPWALQNIELRDYDVKRDRYGLTSNLDYQMNDNSLMFLRGMFNKRTDLERRNRLRIRPEKGDYNSATEIFEGAIDRELKDRTENQTIYNVAAGGKHNFNKFDLDYTVSYSYAEEEKPELLESAFELDEDADMRLNLSDTDLPKYTITNLNNGYELNSANYELDEIVYEENLTTDKDFTTSFNIKYPYLLKGFSSDLKVGAKLRMKSKEQNDKAWEYGWEGDDDILMSQFKGDAPPDDFLDGNYNLGFRLDPDKMRDFFEANRDVEGKFEGEVNREDTDAATYTANENLYAYYGMTTVNMDNLMILAGVRHELLQIDYTGNDVQIDEDGDYESTTEVKEDKLIQHVLPMIHLRYRLSPATNIRTAFTSSISRPNYYDLVPYRFVVREDEEMLLGNPKLEPTTAYNFDLLAEHYFQGIGIISGGFFYKSLDKIIYEYTYEQSGGAFDGFEITQPVQGKSATLYGIEVNWQQQLTFLPGFWNGLGIYANYTYAKSSADLPDRDDTTLPGQAGNVANFAISYEKYGFSGRVGLNYHGKFISEIGEDEDHDIYYDNHLQLDISATQNITKGLQVYFQAINLNNEPLRYYIGETSRPIQREFYSWWMHAGLKYSF